MKAIDKATEILTDHNCAGHCYCDGCALAKLVQNERAGATGQYPAGRDPARADADMGGLRAALSADAAAGRIRVDFGKSLAWLSMLPSEAATFGAALLALAKQMEGTGGAGPQGDPHA